MPRQTTSLAFCRRIKPLPPCPNPFRSLTALLTPPSSPDPMKYLRHLYVQVLVAVLLGSLVGHFYPEFGVALQPLGDAFIKAVKMLIGPIIFSTIVIGI